MSSETAWSEVLEDGIRALGSGDTVRAGALFQRLETAAGSYEGERAKSLSSVWGPFIRLLDRRGYFVDTPEETRVSLDEIRAMGPGFDLYDLARFLSRCDAALAAHLQAPSSRAFPELKPFAAL